MVKVNKGVRHYFRRFIGNSSADATVQAGKGAKATAKKELCVSGSGRLVISGWPAVGRVQQWTGKNSKTIDAKLSEIFPTQARNQLPWASCIQHSESDI
jgi:hypothetical protein